MLSLICDAAAADELIASNPVAKLAKRSRPKLTRSAFPELDHDDVARLIDATPERYRTLLAVAVRTGLRQSELLGLTWSDVDTRGLELHVRQQLDRHGSPVALKTESARRVVPITTDTARRLTELRLASRRSADTDLVFVTGTGSPVTQRSLSRQVLNPALAAAKLPALRWHDLRHIAISTWIASGMPVADVARIAGHPRQRSRSRFTRTSSRGSAGMIGCAKPWRRRSGSPRLQRTEPGGSRKAPSSYERDLSVNASV